MVSFTPRLFYTWRNRPVKRLDRTQNTATHTHRVRNIRASAFALNSIVVQAIRLLTEPSVCLIKITPRRRVGEYRNSSMHDYLQQHLQKLFLFVTSTRNIHYVSDTNCFLLQVKHNPKTRFTKSVTHIST